jgi:UPF0716 protein FxsA
MVMRVFLVYAVLELAVVVALASTIGFGWTLLALLGTFVLGVALAGSQVKRQVRRLRAPVKNPQGAVTDSALVALGTVFVVIPGLLTSVLGLLMLAPPTRAAMRPLAGYLAARGITRRMTGVTEMTGMRPGYGDYIDGEVIEGHVHGTVHDTTPVRRREF